MKIKSKFNSPALGNVALTISVLTLFLVIFSATASAASVDSVKPDKGPEGTLVTITGNDLNTVQYVGFGSSYGGHPQVSKNKITVTAPEGRGTVDIWISGSDLTGGWAFVICKFTYIDVTDYLQTAENLKNRVHDLGDSNTLSKNSVSRLTKDLDNAEENIKIGNTLAAKKDLQDFAQYINNILGKSKKLSSQHRTDLTNMVGDAQDIINAL